MATLQGPEIVTVGELIEQLQQYDKDLPVTLKGTTSIF